MIVAVFKWNKAEVPIQGKWLPYKASLVQNVWSRCDTCPSSNSASAGNNSRAHSKKAVKQFGRPLRQLGAMINISPNFCNPSSSSINSMDCTLRQCYVLIHTFDVFWGPWWCDVAKTNILGGQLSGCKSKVWASSCLTVSLVIIILHKVKIIIMGGGLCTVHRPQ